MDGEVMRERARKRRNRSLRRFGQTATDVTIEEDVRLQRETTICPLCDVALTDAPFVANSKEMDHIVTRRNGGRHELVNVRIICRACNNNARIAEHGVAGQLREFYGGYAGLEGEAKAA